MQEKPASLETCSCFENQITNLNNLHALHRAARLQPSSSSGPCRLDICVQRINGALAACLAFLRCTHCQKDSFSVLLTVSSFQLVMRLFEYLVAQQSVHSGANNNGAPKAGDAYPNGQIWCRLGEYEVSQEEEVAIRRFVVRRALQKGRETLATLKALTEEQAMTASACLSGQTTVSSVDSSPRSNGLPSPPSFKSTMPVDSTRSSGAIDRFDASVGCESGDEDVRESGLADLSGADMTYLQQTICRNEAVLELFMRTISRDLCI